jgi:hypothetical protein
MRTETARMNSAGEAKFRIRTPNSQARAVKVIALDGASERMLRQVARSQWNGALFLTAASFASADGGDPLAIDGWLTDLAGQTRNLIQEIAASDSVIMVATAGQTLHAAGLIGEACTVKHVLTTVLVIGGRDRGGPPLIRALAELRPHVVMLVATSDEHYLADMLSWLQA